VVPVPRVDEFAAQAKAFTAARAKAGAPPEAQICRLLEVVCAPDEDTAIRRAAPYLLDKYAAYFSWGLEGVELDPGARPEDQLRRLAANRFAIGSPAQVTEMLLAQHEAGATHLTMRVSWPGMPQADVLAGIELLGREVLPEVRRRIRS
jgi:alkanesulfonate monooxygenase SsuD/methylene tetrahydromethanopterin reductase-like flavin-dependent oxidoreductase (luciferase family)